MKKVIHVWSFIKVFDRYCYLIGQWIFAIYRACVHKMCHADIHHLTKHHTT